MRLMHRPPICQALVNRYYKEVHKHLKLIDQLKRDEGCVKNDKDMHIPYEDSEGILTIGYGINLQEGLYEHEAEYLLKSRIRIAEKEIQENFPQMVSRMTPPRYNAFLNMAFNLGLSRLMGFKKMLAALIVGDWDAASKEALDSKWAKQVKGRADRIAEAFRNG